MAYSEDNTNERFSLLLLEPGEIYFEDYSVYCLPGNIPEEQALRQKKKGRLKTCSKSIIFDPSDSSQPILKFPLSECIAIEKWTGTLMTKLGSKGNVIYIETGQVIQMRAGNLLEPYIFKRTRTAYLFSLNFVVADDCLPHMCQLRRAATLPAAEQAAMIAAIVHSRQSRFKFDTTWLDNLYETIVLEISGNKVTPLVTNPGRILLSSTHLYFQPYNNAELWPVLKIKLTDIKQIVKRRFLLRHVGLELFCVDQSPVKHLFLSLKTQEARDTLFDKLMEQPLLRLEDTGQENMTLLWQNGVISNYDYILYLNSVADRSFNDLTQYPVFPWVISNYTSPTLDLSDPSVFRDLSKPVGALNPQRLKILKERFNEMPEPKFLYGAHYSAPGFVLYFLVRKMPQYMLCLQNGRYDHPDRMFNSMADSWHNVTTSTSDFKELVPQFYEPEGRGEFLVNTMNLNFGVRQNGERVGDVALPPWASDPADFVSKLREAFECEHVSRNLHHWIDLIFGYKQRGEEAVKADNVFYYMTYEGSVDLDSIKDINERYSREVQIMEYGQIPKQIFSQPHPQRHLLVIPRNMNSRHVNNTEEEATIESNKGMTRRISSCAIGNWIGDMSTLSPVAEYRLHRDEVTDVCLSTDKQIVFSVSQDSLLKVYSLQEKRQLRSVNISKMALSSCVVMADSKTIILGSWDNFVYMYNIEYGRVLQATMAHDDAVSAICWKNGLLATASWDSTAKLWEYPIPTSLKPQNSAVLLAELEHECGVSTLTLNKDNTILITGTLDGHICFWNVELKYMEYKYLVHSSKVWSLSISPDAKTLATCGADHSLKVIDVDTGMQLFNKDAGEELRCLQWDGETVLTGTESGKLLIWDMVKARLVTSKQGHSGPLTNMDISRDGCLAVTCGKDRRVVVWKPEPS